MPNFTDLLTPDNSQLLFIDQQPQMAFGVQSIDRQTLKNNVVALAKAAKIFNVPTTITTVETESFSGHTYPELLAVYPSAQDSGAHLDELLGRPERPRRARRDRAQEDRGVGPVDRGLQPDVRAVGASRTRNTRSTWWPTPPAAPRPTRTNYADGPHDAGRRDPGDLAAGAARMAARLGAQEDLRRRPSHWCRSIPALTAWAWTTPTPWCTRRRSA